MIDTKKLVLQTVGSNVYIGGNKPEIEYLNFSCFNFNNDSGELPLTELSPDFFYFSITPENYLKARQKNIWINWQYNNPDGTLGDRYKRSKMTYKLSELAARRELASYREETFIKPNEQTYHTYNFGNFETDLDKVNTDSLAAKEFIEIGADDIKEAV